MTGVTAPSGAPGTPGAPAARPGRGTMAAALAPVVDALLADADERARQVRAAAEADALAELARAQAEADRLLDQARAEGAAAAAQTAALHLAEARRRAREIVLAARRQAYEQLRDGAVEAVVRQAATPDGRWIGDRLAELVRDRLATPAPVRRSGPGRLVAVARSGHRQAVLGPAELVDQALESLADEVAGLWA